MWILNLGAAGFRRLWSTIEPSQQLCIDHGKRCKIDLSFLILNDQLQNRAEIVMSPYEKWNLFIRKGPKKLC